MSFKQNLSSLLFAFLILLCGLASPSNGVDDKVNKTAIELLTTMSVVVLSTFIIYVLTDILEELYKRTSKHS